MGIQESNGTDVTKTEGRLSGGTRDPARAGWPRQHSTWWIKEQSLVAGMCERVIMKSITLGPNQKIN